MSAVTFKIAAKTDVGLVRTNNEDNLCVISNLDVEGSTWMNNEVCQLGNKGVLLVVADGMGGMNAGEVASEIAVSYIKERFTHEIDNSVLKSDNSIFRFMNDTIVRADSRIKSEGKHRPETKGMGTTVVIAWLYNGRLYVSWCGDSRAYIYNPSIGLYQISKDHSYVQDLVDKGIVKPEDAFDFPESNVITRCLSHSSMKAEPENIDEPYIVNEGDIIMLCTDGLSGMIRDNETAAVIAEHTDNMSECADSLIEAAKMASGADNITVCLCQILSVTNKMNRTDTADIDLKAMEQPTMNGIPLPLTSRKKDRSGVSRKVIAILITIIIILLVALGFLLNSIKSQSNSTTPTNTKIVEKNQEQQKELERLKQKEQEQQKQKEQQQKEQQQKEQEQKREQQKKQQQQEIQQRLQYKKLLQEQQQQIQQQQKEQKNTDISSESSQSQEETTTTSTSGPNETIPNGSVESASTGASELAEPNSEVERDNKGSSQQGQTTTQVNNQKKNTNTKQTTQAKRKQKKKRGKNSY